MGYSSAIDRARIRTGIAREVASELVNDLKSQHDVFRSVFYALFASAIAVFVVLFFSYNGNIPMVLWMMFVGSVVGSHIEIAVPVYATITILILSQLFVYNSTETIVLGPESAENWCHCCSIDVIKHGLYEGFSMERTITCSEPHTTRKTKAIFMDCGYRPAGGRSQIVKMKVCLILDIPVEEHVIHLLTLTLGSSPLRLFAGFIEDFVEWYLRVKLCGSVMCKKVSKMCKRMCNGIEAKEFVEISHWYELKEDLFLVLQDTLKRLETCHLYIRHTV